MEPFHVFDTGDGDDLTFEKQVCMFAGAAVVVGPHGAGLSNVAFTDAAKRCQLVELPMYPHVNRCFGYLASALGIGYWVVPTFRSYYHTFYDTIENGGLVDAEAASNDAAKTVTAALRVALLGAEPPKRPGSTSKDEAPVLAKLRELSDRPLPTTGNTPEENVDVLAVASAQGLETCVADSGSKASEKPASTFTFDSSP